VCKQLESEGVAMFGKEEMTCCTYVTSRIIIAILKMKIDVEEQAGEVEVEVLEGAAQSGGRTSNTRVRS
jgi:hypothetical protein